jgi:hypothetical protein
MHGLIVNQFRNFFIKTHGRDAWSLMRARVGNGIPERPGIDATYPDGEVVELIVGAAQHVDVPLQPMLEAFGEFLSHALMRIYQPLVQPEWRTLDVIERTERSIHTVIRRQDPNATPPYLSATRIAPGEVHIEYTSARHLCSVAIGIVRGLATHFGDAVAIDHPTCMLRGDPKCHLIVRLE